MNFGQMPLTFYQKCATINTINISVALVSNFDLSVSFNLSLRGALRRGTPVGLSLFQEIAALTSFFPKSYLNIAIMIDAIDKTSPIDDP